MHKLEIGPKSPATASAPVFMALGFELNAMNHFAPSNRHEVLLRLKFFNLIKE